MQYARQPEPLYSVLCGVASACSTFVTNILHPFEVIKTRFQSHDGKSRRNLIPQYQGVSGALRDIYHREGFFGLYKGFMVSFVSQMAAHALFFVVYERRLAHYELARKMEHMDAVTWASLEGGIVACVLSQPLWVIKTRMLLNVDKGITERDNFRRSVSEISQQYGWKGYIRGLGLSLMLCTNVFLQMYVYELTKSAYRNLNISGQYYGQEAFICGGIAKAISVLATYPISTVRTRVQQNQFIVGSTQPKYRNAREIVGRMVKEEGVLGFYKGMVANLMKGIPQRALYFYFYELFKRALRVDHLKPDL